MSIHLVGSKAKMMSILLLFILVGVGCVTDPAPAPNLIPDGAELLEMLPTVPVKHINQLNKFQPHFIMSHHPKYGIGPPPECWESSIDLFQYQSENNEVLTGVQKCRAMSQTTMKILILLIANCQHIDIGEPLYVDEATAELCNMSLDESNLSTCMGGLSQLGKRTYLMYTTYIYPICYRLSDEVLVKYLLNKQLDVSARYADMVEHSIHSQKEFDGKMQEHRRELQDLSLLSKRLAHEVENSMKEQLNRIENVDKQKTDEGISVLESLKTNWNMMYDIIYWVMVNGKGLNPMRLLGIQWDFTTPEFEFGWNMFCSFEVADFFLIFVIFRWMLGKIMTYFFPSAQFRNVLKWFFVLQVVAEVVQYISTRNQYVWKLRIFSIVGDFMIGCFFWFVEPILKMFRFVFQTFKVLFKVFKSFFEFLYRFVFKKIRADWMASSFDDVSALTLQQENNSFHNSTKSYDDKKKKYPTYRKR